jgi:hypothetical protein
MTAASVLWICYGALLALAMLSYLLNPRSALLGAGPLAPILWIGVAVGLIVLARRMRRGSTGARTALTVLGALTLIGIWTALFVVPAIVLQFSAKSNAWFQAVNAPGREQ